MLSVDVEFLTGVSVSTQWGALDVPEWPPHPSRVFRAFVAALADGGMQDDEIDALRVLETLGAPQIIFPQVQSENLRVGTETVYVPPNDAAVTGKTGSPIPKAKTLHEARYAIPALRTNKQSRAFPSVALPDDSRTVRYLWPDETVSADHRRSLGRLAHRVSYLGHSHALTRVHVADEHDPIGDTHGSTYHVEPCHDAHAPRLGVPAPGELDRLEQSYRSGQRPSAPATVPYRLVTRVAHPTAKSNLSDRWIVLQSIDRRAPALTATAYIAGVVRRSLIRYADGLSVSDQFPAELKERALELISGHGPDGSASTLPHLAIVPLARLGGDYADGHLHGMALVQPRLGSQAETLLLDDVLRACLAAARNESDTITLMMGERFGVWRVQELTGVPPLRSLDPQRYCSESTAWTTATPIVLDRHPKQEGDAERIIARACSHLGLPEPEVVVPHKHCALTGGVAAWAPRAQQKGTGGWTRRWSTAGKHSDAFAGRPLIHATLTFRDPIVGPVLLGAGRYLGLGLCVPLDTPRT